MATGAAEDLNYEDLLEILDKYSEEEAVNKPFLVKNGIKVIL